MMRNSTNTWIAYSPCPLRRALEGARTAAYLIKLDSVRHGIEISRQFSMVERDSVSSEVAELEYSRVHPMSGTEALLG